MTGSTILSCGHEDSYHPDGWLVRTKDYGFAGRCVRYSTFCSDCFAYWLRDNPEELFSSKDQEEQWFMEERVK